VRIIDGDRPTVYCLPGRRRIMLTTGALTRLDDGELDAVLAHERAHLSGRTTSCSRWPRRCSVRSRR
jgi:Zn-dependent protease with chaperone function